MEKKIILITGSNKGIGYQVARQLAELGHTIIACARNADLGMKAIQPLLQDGHDCHFLNLDVTNEPSIQSAAAHIDKHFGRLDVLINNAGIFLDSPKKTHEVSTDEFRQTLEVNLIGVFSVTNAFLPLLKKSKHASIINMSSDLGSLAQASNPHSKYDAVSGPAYRVSKAALNMLTLSFARELRDTPIAVNAVSPGWCKTDLGTDMAPRSAEQGADTVVWLATQEEAHHGQFFFERETINW
jgi:NAD(P)-dependent dehydrogenase (short-subunit alcohol dehydrogenase family)